MRVEEEQYLAHYGILGMKWGTRRAIRKYGSVKSARKQARTDFNKKSDAYNESSRKTIFSKQSEAVLKRRAQAAKQYDKSKKQYRIAKNKAANEELNKKYGSHTKSLNKRIANMPTGKALAQTLMLGSYGALKYNQALDKGKSKGKAFTEAFMKSWGNNLTLGSLERREKKANKIITKYKQNNK